MLLVVALAGCDEPEIPTHLRVVGGDWQAGKSAIEQHDCGVCHVVPGVRGARGTVGPSLAAFGRRSYIAGKLPNRPGMLTQWIQNAPLLAPDTAMPNLGVTEDEARDIAAYLYRLR